VRFLDCARSAQPEEDSAGEVAFMTRWAGSISRPSLLPEKQHSKLHQNRPSRSPGPQKSILATKGA
jgi:hypothetical protein